MKIIVLKFGGTSVGTIDKIKKATKIIKEYKKFILLNHIIIFQQKKKQINDGHETYHI